MGRLLAATIVPCRGVAKLVKAPDFDSGIRRFESFHPCQNFQAAEQAGRRFRPALFGSGIAGKAMATGAHCQVTVAKYLFVHSFRR